MDIIARIAIELSARPQQVQAAVQLLDEGSTVPFIARYRKEATGGLDDAQLRQLEERLLYLRELEERRQTVLASIREQGKLTSDLEAAILAADNKTALEDLYLPYRPKRQTKAHLAREAGIEPLAELLLAEPDHDPAAEAAAFCNPEKGYDTAEKVLEGARHILIERFAEDPRLSGELRETVWEQGLLASKVSEGKEEAGKKYRDYFDYREPLTKIPSHRALALLRGREEGILTLHLSIAAEEEPAHAEAQGRIATRFGVQQRGRPADGFLGEAVRLAWKARLLSRIELDLLRRIKEAADAAAIGVFAENLKDLLLAAPAGARCTLGLDPGLRTGVKVAVVGAAGQVLETATLYPHPPRKQWDPSIAELKRLIEAHGVELIAIGNGTASRETDALAAELMAKHPELGVKRVMVSEAGASVYSASKLASDELPELDVSLRGAVSIARRLQDPLAELVKIEPKSIGVGQYQHDVNQSHLSRSLGAVVEDCVNSVGVDVNTASPALLQYVAGLSSSLSRQIVAWRAEHGAFRSREQLREVPRLGPKAFEQAAGFLRILDGENPLDASAVHPESYPVVERILADCHKDLGAILGDSNFLQSIDPARYTDERFGLPTVQDILAELVKPGRDPRGEFVPVEFREGIHELAQLEPGMRLPGVVTNVAAFGAFVDIGVHQDGLVHISELADRFVKDPREVVKAGDRVTVTVLEVDASRKRIGLSMRSQPGERGAREDRPAQAERGPRPDRPPRGERLHRTDDRGTSTRPRRGDAGPTKATAKPQEGMKSAFAEALEKALRK